MIENKGTPEAGHSIGGCLKKEDVESAKPNLSFNAYNHRMQANKLNRRQAIRARCLDCSGASKKEVRDCPITECPLYPYRIGTGRQEPKAREKAIRSYCLECMNDQSVEVGLCPSGNCTLFPYRQTVPTIHKKKRIGEKLSDKTLAEGKR